MDEIIELLFQAHHLKHVKRTGYEFLGIGSESVAEHSFSTVFIGFVLTKLLPDVNAFRVVAMCILHDLTEARTGDLNYVQKHYISVDETKALADTADGLPFGQDLTELIEEFNNQATEEAKLAHDADQLSFLMELKMLSDMGYHPPGEWMPNISGRLKTQKAIQISDMICKTKYDQWWRKIFLDSKSD